MRSRDSWVSPVPGVASVCLLSLALVTNWPYGFFQFLRLVTCAAASYFAVMAFQRHFQPWGWSLLAMAILFNPIWPIHLSRGTWRLLDAATVPVMVAATRRLSR